MSYKIWIFDFEVFKYLWLVVIKELGTDNYKLIYNNNYNLKKFINLHKNDLFVGFNSKGYDDYILEAIYYGADNQTVKDLNDWIITEEKYPWKFPFLNYKKKPVRSCDLKDDLAPGLSLKEIEGNLLMDIEESEVDFNLDRPLTELEFKKTVKYCVHDVDATEILYTKRANYLNAKRVIAKMGGIDERTALNLTNARLTALYLGAVKHNHSLEEIREYQIPENLNLNRIPNEVIDFYGRLKDTSIPIKNIIGFKDKKRKIDIKGEKLNITIGDCPSVVSYGGIHGASGKDNINMSNEDEWLLLNYDVASLYPSAWINYGYGSRNIPLQYSHLYKELRDMRVSAKQDGGKSIIERFNLPEDSEPVSGLKLPLNTAYGAMGQVFNDLYDPLMAKAICITNQLAMVELCCTLLDIPSISFKNINTDGVMFLIKKQDKPKALDIIKEWENRTGYVLEEENIKRYISKDVNDYFMEFINGKVKTKGGYIGRYKGGSYDKNSMIIVQKAIVDYFDKGIEPDVTINECDDIFQFQIISKMGGSYLKCYHKINNELVDIQKVNRVYASRNEKYGKIIKFKIDKGKEHYENVASLPPHCIIDNSNKLSINDIDKSFYINLAYSRILDFIT